MTRFILPGDKNTSNKVNTLCIEIQWSTNPIIFKSILFQEPFNHLQIISIPTSEVATVWIHFWCFIWFHEPLSQLHIIPQSTFRSRMASMTMWLWLWWMWIRFPELTSNMPPSPCLTAVSHIQSFQRCHCGWWRGIGRSNYGDNHWPRQCVSWSSTLPICHNNKQLLEDPQWLWQPYLCLHL